MKFEPRNSEIILFIFNILLNPIAIFYLISPFVGEPLFFGSRLEEIGYVIFYSLLSALLLGLLTIIISFVIQKQDFSLRRSLIITVTAGLISILLSPISLPLFVLVQVFAYCLTTSSCSI